MDAWGNTFHSRHENEGVFCFSCSRIISEGVTQGGYIYSDGRYLCSLCQTSVVKEDSVIQNSYHSVLTQLESVGLRNIPKKIPIELLNLHQLINNSGNLAHAKLKGFTRMELLNISKINQTRTYQMFLLKNCMKVLLIGPYINSHLNLSEGEAEELNREEDKWIRLLRN